MPNILEKGEKEYSNFIKLLYGEEILSNVFRIENHELFWFTDEDFDSIMAQQYFPNDPEFQGEDSHLASVGNPIIKYFLENYPPSN